MPFLKLFKRHSHTKQYHIFIDETISYSYENNRMMQAKNFYTAFVVLPTFCIDELNERYFQKMYHSKSQKELKSSNVSDTVNKKALEIVKPYLAQAYIYQRPAYISNKSNANAQLIQQALILQSYIYPLKVIIQDLRKQNPDVDLKLHINIDETNLNKQLDNQYFTFKVLNKILDELGERDKVSFSYNICDSKKALGIQIADMLAGAYRKQEKYENSGDNTQIIPFQINRIKEQGEPIKNDTFLNLYGMISLEMAQPQKEDLRNFKKLLTQPVTNYEIQAMNQFTQATSNLNKISQIKKDDYLNKQVVKQILQLNTSIIRIIKPLPKGYHKNLSRKFSDKNTNKTIDNMLKNLDKLKTFDLTKIQSLRLNHRLKRFNTILQNLLK
ncbi:DUF3800 domain-containing protein [uncultured Lactobacillus sp.]|uniref:DUF3800 domain-containing protein n=1 Tax=uncultured Lactobacillus sp. TaxID=153152 RepID=UPI0026134D48|nr:DUF3800 domain-containing protein [uncultured Lactobacillus sp.]